VTTKDEGPKTKSSRSLFDVSRLTFDALRIISHQDAGRTHMAKKLIIGFVGLVVVGIAIYLLVGRGSGAGVASAQQATATPMPVVMASKGVVADAKVVPVYSAQLGVATSGIVSEVWVKEGDTVEAGQTLIKLASARQAAAAAQAEAQLQRAQAHLSELKAGARAEERRAARATLDAAQARLKRVQDGALPAEVAAAQASLAEAQAALQKTLEGSDKQQVIAAQADFLNAAAAVKQAQAAYDQVKGDPHIGLRPEALQLEQVTNQYKAAQARLAQLTDGPSTADIAGARARVQRAQAQLDLLTASKPADVAAAEAEVRGAQAQLDLLAAGTRPETIAAAEADVTAAQAGLAQAQAALAETELKAPFAGTIAVLNTRVGEQVVPGSPVAQLADLSQWQIETDDLTEINVVRVREGATATVSFDALPDVKTTGKVIRIRPLGENKQGDITYVVVIQPDQLDSRLRWNMTASVAIESE
jgi:HlyD family secretion protein